MRINVLIRTVVLILLNHLIVSCSTTGECSKYQNVSFQDLESSFEKHTVANKAHELYLFGHCEVVVAKPILERYKDSKTINHHAQHKGMSLGYIASISIEKLANKKS